MKYRIITLIGLAGSTLAVCFGGWDKFLQTLLLFMAIDWITGEILLPVVFGKSQKSENGALESRAGWKGLCRKGMTLLYVLIAARLDALMGTEYLRDAVCIGFIANEGLSITENALRVFQKNTGQSSDGICGKNSWIAISTHMKANTFAA